MLSLYLWVQKSGNEKCTLLLLWIGEKNKKTCAAHSNSVIRKQSYCKCIIINLKHLACKVLGSPMTELHLLLKYCNYSNWEEMLKDHIVFGIQVKGT